MYQTNFKYGIIRVLGESGEIQGAGFLVQNSWIVTCAHVVEKALISALTETPYVWIDFPFLPNKDRQKAFWQTSNIEQDVAILRIHEPPTQALPICLVICHEWENHHFKVCGFPTGFRDGQWAGGILIDTLSSGHLQGVTNLAQGYSVTGGYSGSPVWDEQIGGVCGMVNAAERNPERRTFTLIPSALLIQAWPPLEGSSLVLGSINYWENQRNRLQLALPTSTSPSSIRERIEEIEFLLHDLKQGSAAPDFEITAHLIKKWYEEDAAQSRPRRKPVPVRGVFPPGINLNIFQNRQKEHRQALENLGNPKRRMVTIFGFRGYGKTALAANIIQSLKKPGRSGYRPDGIIFLSAQGQKIQLEDVYAYAADLFFDVAGSEIERIAKHPRRSAAEKALELIQALQGKELLICFDRLDELIDDEGRCLDSNVLSFIETCLSQEAGIKFLITTCRQLQLDVALSMHNESIDLRKGLDARHALKLLEAMDAQGDFGIKNYGEEELTNILDRLNYNPQAIKYIFHLLAQGDGLVTFQEVAQQADQNSEIIDQLAEVNYQLIDWRGRKVIEALSVFRSPVPVEAVDEIVEPFYPGFRAILSIRRLVNSFLIDKNREQKTICLHPSLCEYTYRQIPEEGSYSRAALEELAAKYYLKAIPPSAEWRHITATIPFQRSIEHWMRAGQYEIAAELVDSNARDLLRLGAFSFLIETYQRLLKHLPGEWWQAKVSIDLGTFYLTLGDYAKADEHLARGLALAARQNDINLETAALVGLFGCALDMGQFEEALTSYQQWQSRVLDQPPSAAAQCAWLNDLSVLHLYLGSTEQAQAECTQALHLAQTANLPDMEAQCLGYIGNCYLMAGERTRGVEVLQQAVKLAEAQGDRLLYAEWLHSYADLLLDENQPPAALPVITQAMAVADEVNSYRLMQECCFTMGVVCLFTGRLAEAQTYAERAAQYDIPLFNPANKTLSGVIALQQSHPSKAQVAFQEAVDHANLLLQRYPRNPLALYWRSLAWVGLSRVQPVTTDRALQSFAPAQALTRSPGITTRIDQLLRLLLQ